MPRRCTIEGCLSKSGQPEHRGVTFHSFPFDSKTRQTWLANCRIPNAKNITKSVLVCSRHFKRADFQPVKGNKYMVKQGTYPSIFPWGKIDTTQSATTETIIKTDETNPKTTITMEPDENEPISTETNTNLDTSIQIENEIKASTFGTPIKRPSSEAFAKEQSEKPSKIAKINDSASVNAVVGVGDLATVSENTISTSLKSVSPRKSESLSFVPGVRLEAQDFDGVWHAAKIIEVDNDDREVLIKFEKAAKSTNTKISSGAEEWIPMNSSRLRQIIEKITNKTTQSFVIGEKCMARWAGARKFPATIIEIMENDMYEVLFEDGFQKVVKANYISKIKPKVSTLTAASTPTATVSTPSKATPAATTSNVPSTPTTPVTTASKSSKSTPSKKLWPLISKESLNFDELNLATIPEDGEWCCHWVNDQPIGKEGFLMVGDHKKPTVIVEDWRLPSGWIKHMYQRSNVLGKWDVILVSPQGKRFRSKADLKQFIEEQGQVYNPDVYDFSIHRRRAKDINAYAYTKDYKPPVPLPKESAFAGITPAALPETGTLAKSLSSTNLINSSVASDAELKTSPSKIAEDDPQTSSLPLEDGFVYVGALKVQLIENLFRCPEESCNKNFRKENHLQIHVKHYHHELAKLLGVCPNMQELAWKRTVGTTHEEPTPKNLISNQQFFAKVHQQEMQSRTHRKSSSTTHTPISSAQTSPLSTTTVQAQSTTISEEQLAVSAVDKIIATIIETSSSPAESSPKTSVLKEDLEMPHPTGDDIQIFEENLISSTNISSPITVAIASPLPSPLPVSTPKTKTHSTVAKTSHASSSTKKSSSSSARKSNRQRTTKKYLTANLKNPSQVFDASFPVSTGPISDFEETRHSFNATPDKLPSSSTTSNKKSKTLHNLLISESNDGTTGSLSEQLQSQSQSPKYINENGEMIKIVRMRQEEIINCLCSYCEEDGLMIQCELCLCWQHGICNGFEKQSQVPDKYVCYICRNPQRGRSSLKYIHDQDWLYEGKLPIANYHAVNPNVEERFEALKKSHTLTGNLLEIRKFLHSLRVKINIAENKDHPKMYLWAKKWEKSPTKEIDEQKDDEQIEENKNIIKENDGDDVDMKNIDNENDDKNIGNDDKNKIETKIQPTIPQPEAAIDSVECQRRLLEHIKTQQSCVMDRLQNIEDQIMEMESMDSNTEEMDGAKTREILSLMIKDLEIMKNISKINTVPKSYTIY